MPLEPAAIGDRKKSKWVLNLCYQLIIENADEIQNAATKQKAHWIVIRTVAN